MSTYQERIAERTRTAVARALLHFTRDQQGKNRSGSFSPDTVAPRIKRAIDQGLTEESLTTLLNEVAAEAVEDATREVEWITRELLTKATKQAERSDSLSFHRYVEDLTARIKEQAPRTGSMDTTDYSGIQAGTMTDEDTEILTGGRVKPLDSEPWVSLDGTRRYVGTWQGAGRMFAPRAQYEQDRSKYPEYSR